MGSTLLGYHGLSSTAPRDALCWLRLKINQCFTPPSGDGKSKNPPFNKPLSLRKVPGYYNSNTPATSVHVGVWVCRKKGFWSPPHQTPCHHKILQAVEEEREPLPLWWGVGRGASVVCSGFGSSKPPNQTAHGWADPLPEGRASCGSNCCQAAAVRRYSYIHIRLPRPQWSPPSTGFCVSRCTVWLKVIQVNFWVEGLGREGVKKWQRLFFFLILSSLFDQCSTTTVDYIQSATRGLQGGDWGWLNYSITALQQ